MNNAETVVRLLIQWLCEQDSMINREEILDKIESLANQ